MSGTVAILPAKQLARAKRRLAGALAPTARRTLATAMLGDVLAALQCVDALDAVLVVTADPQVRQIARSHGALTLDERHHTPNAAVPHESGQNQALLHGIACAGALGAAQVVCLAGDCPLLDPAELDELLRRPPIAQRCVVVVPDRHGTGTNALLLRPPEALEPRYGPGSLVRHLQLAQEAGLPGMVAQLGSLALDVDTPADLALLERRLATHPGATRTRTLLSEMSRPGLAARA